MTGPFLQHSNQGFLSKIAMFHDLLTFRMIYQQSRHFIELFQGFLLKKLFLCTRETI